MCFTTAAADGFPPVLWCFASCVVDLRVDGFWEALCLGGSVFLAERAFWTVGFLEAFRVVVLAFLVDAGRLAVGFGLFGIDSVCSGKRGSGGRWRWVM